MRTFKDLRLFRSFNSVFINAEPDLTSDFFLAKKGYSDIFDI